MKHRKAANGRGQKRRFSRTAMKTNGRNLGRRPMRGGFRL